MKITRMWYLLGLLSFGGAAWPQSMQQTAPIEKAVAALENQWLQSQKTNNPDLVAPLIADKFVYTASDGKMSGKAAMLAEAKATKWTSVETEDVQIGYSAIPPLRPAGSKERAPMRRASPLTIIRAGPTPG